MPQIIQLRDRLVRNLTIGVEGENGVEDFIFTDFPEYSENQVVTLKWVLSPEIGDIVILPKVESGYSWTVGNNITQYGNVSISAYFTLTDGIKTWKSFPFSIRTYELPDGEGTSIFTPTIIDQMLIAIEQHIINMSAELEGAQTARTGAEAAQGVAEQQAGISTAQAVIAATKASEASGSAVAALASKNDAETAKGVAEAKAVIATTKAQEASDSADAALSSETAAASSASGALTSKTAAAASEASASKSKIDTYNAKSDVLAVKGTLDSTYEKVVLREVLTGGEVIINTQTVDEFKADVTSEIDTFETGISAELADVANQTGEVSSEVVLARGGKSTLGDRLDDMSDYLIDIDAGLFTDAQSYMTDLDGGIF